MTTFSRGDRRIDARLTEISVVFLAWSRRKNRPRVFKQMKISAHNLSMSYRDGESDRTILDHVELEIDHTQPNILIGPSGSGKSTLLYLLAGLRKPTSGEIDYSEITGGKTLAPDRLRYEHFGFIFQKSYLLPYLTALDNICLANKDKTLKEKGMDWLKRFGMKHLSKKKPFQMSGGECQRIAIIRALVKDPDIIFADEPTAALDNRNNAVMIYELLREVSADIILVTATHDLSLFHGDERILKIENCKVTI